MPNTGLYGPYVLSSEKIDEVVTKTSAGVYVLTREDSSDSFTVNYVGRSDSDLNGRLKKWVGVNGYKRFKFGYFDSAKAAFEKECSVYHDFSGLNNEIHPQRPAGTNWQCPSCNVFQSAWWICGTGGVACYSDGTSHPLNVLVIAENHGNFLGNKKSFIWAGRGKMRMCDACMWSSSCR